MKKRIEKASVLSEFFGLATCISTVPKEECEAIALFPGQGEPQRYTEAIGEWNANHNIKQLFVAAENTRERTARKMSMESLCEIGLSRCDNVHFGVHADHTLDQAVWLSDQLQEHRVRSCLLYTAPFFLPRAFGTVVKQLLKRGMTTVVIPVPVRIAPASIVPEAGITGWEMFAGEAVRIEEYQKKGDVATFEELRSYIDSIWRSL